MKADLHVHSQFSDGTYTPRELAQKLKEAGMGLVALCDHNTTDGCEEMRAACAATGMQFITGAEIDCVFAPFSLHVLALGVDVKNAALQQLLAETRDNIEQMSTDLIAAMEKAGEPVHSAEYAQFIRNAANGGWKGIDYLRGKGYTASFPACMQVYKQYGAAPCQAYAEFSAVCKIIHMAGGTAVLAHPGDRLPGERGAFLQAMEQLRENGLDGVECYYPSHTSEATQWCLSFCRKNNLCITAGSDTHGAFAEQIDGIAYVPGAVDIEVSNLRLGTLL